MSKPRKTRVVLGVTGSIAAYKAAELARFMMKRGAVVRVVMSSSAERFISALTFESITGQPVLRSFWDETQPGAIGHIKLADWADVVVIAPASADILAKAAHGFAESPLLAVLLATKAPVVMAPAMNVNMYDHPQTRQNMDTLRARGVSIVEPDSGDLACGWKGRGRLPKPHHIYDEVCRTLAPQDLYGISVVVSSGPTREAIDPVRFISNRSSGKMGIALAREAYLRGATVTLVHGPLYTASPAIPRGITRIPVTSAIEMQDALLSTLGKSETANTPTVVIMAAAVSDFRPEIQATSKLKKAAMKTTLQLTPNPDILAGLGARRSSQKSTFLVGFAVETGSEQELLCEAERKLHQKNADMIVGNFASDSFDRDTNRVWLLSQDGSRELVDTARKSTIARRIIDAVVTRRKQV